MQACHNWWSMFSRLWLVVRNLTTSCMHEVATICPRPCKLTFDLLTLKVVSESRVTWTTSMPILVALGLSVFDLGPMYATDKTSDAQHRLMSPTMGRGHNNCFDTIDECDEQTGVHRTTTAIKSTLFFCCFASFQAHVNIASLLTYFLTIAIIMSI